VGRAPRAGTATAIGGKDARAARLAGSVARSVRRTVDRRRAYRPGQPVALSAALGCASTAVLPTRPRAAVVGLGAAALLGALSAIRPTLAVALLGAPRLLVLDEPTVGLDPVLRRDLWRLFHKPAAEGTTLLVSSHVMDEAERCDTLLLLRDGRLLAHGTPAEIRRCTGGADLEEAFLRLIEEPPA